MKITQYAVDRRLATSAIVLALVVLGLYGFWRLPVDFLPDVTYPLVRITVWWRGATPEEIDRNIADPIERQMATVDRLDSLDSSCIEGMYQLNVNFRYGADVDVAYQDVVAAMGRATRQLPEDIEPPLLFKTDPSQLPVLQLTVHSDRWDLVQLRDWADNWLQDQLLAVPGVAGTEIVGGLKREIRILLDPVAMEKHRIALDTVIKHLAAENIEQFAGRVRTGRREIIARTAGEYRDLDEIRSIVLAREGQAKLYLRDVAEVVDSHEEVRIITRLDGKPCVKLSALKQADANTVEVAKAVGRKLADLEPVLPPGLRLGMVENQATYVETALAGVRNAAIQAAVLLIIVVYLFLGSVRQVLVMIIAMPLTLVLNFGLMKLAGFSLNIFSLGGLVISIGVVLDNSIVVLESVTRRRHERPETSPSAQAVDGTDQVGPAVVAATLSFLALFIPFLLVPGLTTLLFRELILVMAGIVVISLTVAVTLTPMLTAALFGRGHRAREKKRFERFFRRVTEGYGRLLGWVLGGRWIATPAFLGALLLAFWVMGRLGGEFLPPVDDGRIMIKVRLPTGAAVTETDRVLRQVEQQLGEDELIESRFTLVGGLVRGLYTYEIANEGEIDIQLVPRAERRVSTDEYVNRLRPLAAQVAVPGGKVMVMQRRIRGIRGLGQADIEVKIRGQDVATLFALARSTAGAMNELEHFKNVYVSMDLSKPEYQVQVDRVKAAELGVSVSDVAQALRSLITGAVATRYRDSDEYYNVRIMVPEEQMTSREDVESLPLTSAEGEPLRVRDVARVEQAVGPVEIVREDQAKQVIVRGDAAGVSVATALTELKVALAKIDRPVGYEFTYGGQAEMMADMRNTILAVLAFAVFFSFIVLAVQFNSLRLPALILAGVPVSLTGVAFLLYLTGLSFGATVVIGVLVVLAATVNDGVLLLTFAQELQERGALPPIRAVLDAAMIRLRPRVMTTLTTMAGFLPLALNLEEGGDMLQPMAVGAIGGLAMEMAVALFLMPCLYVFFTRGQARAAGQQA